MLNVGNMERSMSIVPLTEQYSASRFNLDISMASSEIPPSLVRESSSIQDVPQLLRIPSMLTSILSRSDQAPPKNQESNTSPQENKSSNSFNV